MVYILLFFGKRPKDKATFWKNAKKEPNHWDSVLKIFLLNFFITSVKLVVVTLLLDQVLLVYINDILISFYFR